MVRATFAGITTALSSLQANQKRLDIVGQNLSNMNTPGYTRQQLDVSSLNHLSPVSHYANGAEINVGFGVKMDGVSRIRDPYLDVQYRDQIVKSSYIETRQTSLDTLANFLDEHTISGIRQAFDDIQSVLTNQQDPPKVNDAIFDSELRARMQALTNAFNEAARQIEKAERQEYEFLNGDGTSENGAVQTVNNLLKQIGDLNVQIKRNQIVDQPSLELMDERDMLLDELASYIPIEVSYYKDSTREDWPYDLRVEMLYNDETGKPQRMTLVNGSDRSNGQKNYGQVYITDSDGTVGKNPDGTFVVDGTGHLTTTGGTKNGPIHTQLGFAKAPTAPSKNTYPAAPATTDTTVISTDTTQSTFASGSIQSSLDMLGQKGTGQPGDTVKGYQYYMGELDKLANAFVQKINEINNSAVEYAQQSTGDYTKPNPGDLLKNYTAKDIAISDAWAAGSVHLGTGIKKNDANGNPITPSMNDTVLEMLKAFESTYPNDSDNLGLNLSKNTFVSYMNHISTMLATESFTNQQELKTSVTILNGIQSSRDEISAVSLDEEASNMMAYLNAYNAASRLMTTLDEALNTLINNTGLVGR